MNWIEDFLKRCLEGVPEGTYRARTGKELGDHLLSLSRDLEQSGYPPEEARALAISRMGDPAELARRYVREWRRRTLRPRWLAAAGLVLFIPCIMAAGYLYIFNARNFGKPHPAYWGITAILAAQVLLWNLHSFFTKRWTAARLACLVLAAIQLPPIYCWIAFSGTYEFTGVMMVPGWLGLSVHLGFLAWSTGNYKLLTRFQQEDGPIQRTQSA